MKNEKRNSLQLGGHFFLHFAFYICNYVKLSEEESKKEK